MDCHQAKQLNFKPKTMSNYDITNCGRYLLFTFFADIRISYRISRKYDMELNLAVGNFLWSLPNLICHVFWITLKIILGSWAIVKFNLLNEFIFQIANIFSSQIFYLYGIYYLDIPCYYFKCALIATRFFVPFT